MEPLLDLRKYASSAIPSIDTRVLDIKDVNRLVYNGSSTPPNDLTVKDIQTTSALPSYCVMRTIAHIPATEMKNRVEEFIARNLPSQVTPVQSYGNWASVPANGFKTNSSTFTSHITHMMQLAAYFETTVLRTCTHISKYAGIQNPAHYQFDHIIDPILDNVIDTVCVWSWFSQNQETNKRTTPMLVFLISPWIVERGFLARFSHPEVSSDHTIDKCNFEVLWSKIIALCKVYGARYWVISTWSEYLFGAFLDDFTGAALSPISHYQDTEPNVISSLIYWAASSNGAEGGYMVPRVQVMVPEVECEPSNANPNHLLVTSSSLSFLNETSVTSRPHTIAGDTRRRHATDTTFSSDRVYRASKSSADGLDDNSGVDSPSRARLRDLKNKTSKSEPYDRLPRTASRIGPTRTPIKKPRAHPYPMHLVASAPATPPDDLGAKLSPNAAHISNRPYAYAGPLTSGRLFPSATVNEAETPSYMTTWVQEVSKQFAPPSPATDSPLMRTPSASEISSPVALPRHIVHSPNKLVPYSRPFTERQLWQRFEMAKSVDQGAVDDAERARDQEHRTESLRKFTDLLRSAADFKGDPRPDDDAVFEAYKQLMLSNGANIPYFQYSLASGLPMASRSVLEMYKHVGKPAPQFVPPKSIYNYEMGNFPEPSCVASPMNSPSSSEHGKTTNIEEMRKIEEEGFQEEMRRRQKQVDHAKGLLQGKRLVRRPLATMKCFDNEDNRPMDSDLYAEYNSQSAHHQVQAARKMKPDFTVDSSSHRLYPNKDNQKYVLTPGHYPGSNLSRDDSSSLMRPTNGSQLRSSGATQIHMATSHLTHDVEDGNSQAFLPEISALENHPKIVFSSLAPIKASFMGRRRYGRDRLAANQKRSYPADVAQDQVVIAETEGGSEQVPHETFSNSAPEDYQDSALKLMDSSLVPSSGVSHETGSLEVATVYRSLDGTANKIVECSHEDIPSDSDVEQFFEESVDAMENRA